MPLGLLLIYLDWRFKVRRFFRFEGNLIFYIKKKVGKVLKLKKTFLAKWNL